MNKKRTTSTSRIINASRETLYRALTDPVAIGKWLAPGEMTGKVHSFDLRVGGGYHMSLFYPSTDKEARGKTGTHEDRFTARFLELSPPEKNCAGHQLRVGQTGICRGDDHGSQAGNQGKGNGCYLPVYQHSPGHKTGG